MMSHNRVKIFGTKWDEVTGTWRKLRNEKLHKSFSSSNTMRMMNSRRIREADI
jgi:hypothetical protein